MKISKICSVLFGTFLGGLLNLTTYQIGAAELKIGSDLPSIEVHGFLSQGFLYSTDYNYLGKSKDGSFKFTEAGLNATINPLPRTRVTTQVFTYDVGETGGYDIVLDYAQIDYTFSDLIGLRVGRVRRPEGISNHIQDVDLSRTWVLLPQGVYNARWRDFYVAIDGVEVSGTLPLQKAGSISYELYYGYTRPQLNGGLATQKANLPPFSKLNSMNSPQTSGGQIWWNAPLEGLRVGVALSSFQDLTFRSEVGRQSIGSPLVKHYSLEYLRKSWTFQAEYYTYSVDYTNSGGGLPTSVKHIEPDSWFASAAYRFNRWFELGGYYSEYYTDMANRSGTGLAIPSDAYQKDTALALRFDLKDWWIMKVEAHYIKGTGQLYDNINNPVRGGNGWSMLALKSTFCF